VTVDLLEIRLGKPVLKDGSGGQKGGLWFAVDGERRVFDWKGVEIDDAARTAWVAARIRQIEQRYGIDGWYWNRDSGPSSEPVSTSGVGSKPRKLWSLCPQFPSGDHYFRSSQCSKPITEVGDAGCPAHVAGQRRSDASMAAHRERWAKVDERRKLARLKTADLAELWERACFEYGIEPERQGNPRVSESGEAVVDVEILEMFLRRLADRE
jgi:hypothetical protein